MTETRRAKILNVNDTAAALYLVSRILRTQGYEVIEAVTGKEAIAAAASELPDLVVLDIKLPDVTGYEVAKQLRANPRTANIGVLQTSATFVSGENKALGIDAGADAYLTQPFESIELVAIVRSLLRLKGVESESRHRAEALAQADRRKDEFLAMLAHELRNPLSAIVTGAKLLEARVQGDTTAASITDTVGRQARHLARLIDDLLDVSRITQGKIQLRRAQTDLRAPIEAALQTTKSLFEKRNQVISVKMTDEALFADADAARIEQIVTNLLTNAAKYSNANGHVEVSVNVDRRDATRYATICVHDDGIGIAPENLGALFDLFYQVDGTLARSQSGLGIGLTMVRRLVEMHGGRVWAESGGSGKGSTFRVELPLLNLGTVPLAPPPVRSLSRPGMRRILLVDDNVDSCELFHIALQAAGHHVEVAHDGEHGLELALKGAFEVAIIDIGLPRLDGYQVASAIVEKLERRRPYLIAMTGYGRPEDRAMAFKVGFDRHLVKPVDLAELEEAIEETRTSVLPILQGPQARPDPS